MNNRITLISFNFPTEAHMAKGYLAANGLDTILNDEMTVQFNNFYSNAIGGVKIMVNESDYEKGIKLLIDGGYLNDPSNKVVDSKIKTFDKNTLENTKNCPVCNSDNIGRNKKMNIFMLGIYLIIGIILPTFRITYRCFDCGLEWKLR